MVRARERYLVDESGNRLAVVLPIEEYEQLLEAIEELEGVRAFDEALASSDEALPFERAVAEIQREGR